MNQMIEGTHNKSRMPHNNNRVDIEFKVETKMESISKLPRQTHEYFNGRNRSKCSVWYNLSTLFTTLLLNDPIKGGTRDLVKGKRRCTNKSSWCKTADFLFQFHRSQEKIRKKTQADAFQNKEMKKRRGKEKSVLQIILACRQSRNRDGEYGHNMSFNSLDVQPMCHAHDPSQFPLLEVLTQPNSLYINIYNYQ